MARDPDQVHPNVRQRTYETYQQTVEHHLLPMLGSIKLQKLTPWHLRRLYHLKRRQQCAPSTIQKIHRVLSHALNDALKLGHVTQNVCLSMELPAERKRQSKAQALTVEQARQVRYGTLLCDLEQHRVVDLLYVKRD